MQVNLYVLPKDHEHEKAMLDAFTREPCYKYVHHTNDDLYPYDGTIYSDINNKVIAYVECKWRMKQYHTLKIDAQKVQLLVQAADEKEVVGVLLVYWEDKRELGYISAHHAEKAPKDVVQRTDRGDPNDRDISRDIPISWFHRSPLAL